MGERYAIQYKKDQQLYSSQKVQYVDPIENRFLQYVKRNCTSDKVNEIFLNDLKNLNLMTGGMGYSLLVYNEANYYFSLEHFQNIFFI